MLKNYPTIYRAFKVAIVLALIGVFKWYNWDKDLITVVLSLASVPYLAAAVRVLWGSTKETRWAYDLWANPRKTPGGCLELWITKRIDAVIDNSHLHKRIAQMVLGVGAITALYMSNWNLHVLGAIVVFVVCFVLTCITSVYISGSDLKNHDIWANPRK